MSTYRGEFDVAVIADLVAELVVRFKLSNEQLRMLLAAF